MSAAPSEVPPSSPGAALGRSLAAEAVRSGLDPRRVAVDVNARHPRLREAILAEADRALSGRMILPGTGAKPYFVGDPVTWHRDPVGDPEFVWTLNRMGHWPALARAGLLTGDPRYAGKIVAEWSDWIDRCPAPRGLDESDFTRTLTGAHPWRLLEVGIRAFDSWHVTLGYLAAMGRLDESFLERVARSLREHGLLLFTWGPRLWPEAEHNHLVMEMLGLLGVACRCPFFPEAETWRGEAIRQLERCMDRQITVEGGQIEGCPGYHGACVHFFARALVLARQEGVCFSSPFLARFGRAVEYALHATRPTGVIVPWGDTDALPQVVGTAAHAWLATGDADPLRVLARFSDPDVFRDECEAFVWQIPDFATFQAEIARPPAAFPPRLRWHRALDQATVRSAWTRDALSVFFGCHTPVHNGHAHIDSGSFDLCALGKALLVDPGRFTYRGPDRIDPDRYAFKRAASHSMLLVDERDPFEFRDGWSFGPQRTGRIVEAGEGDGLARLVAEHDNFHPARHRRTLVVLADRAVIVTDEIAGLDPLQAVQLYFHLDSLTVAWDEARRRAVTCDRGANLAVVVPAGVDAALLPGRLSERIDVERPSTRLRLGDRGGEPRRVYRTVLVPFLDGNVPDAFLEGECLVLDGERFPF